MEECFDSWLFLATLAAVAGGTLLGTLYVGKIQYSDLNNVTGLYDATTRALAANEAYRQQVANKTAVPQQAIFKIVYKDGSIEMAEVTSPLFSEALILSPGTLRLKQQLGNSSLSFSDSSQDAIYATGHWEWYETYTDHILTATDGYQFVIDSYSVTTSDPNNSGGRHTAY
jgi:hypothetical protein